MKVGRFASTSRCLDQAWTRNVRRGLQPWPRVFPASAVERSSSVLMTHLTSRSLPPVGESCAHPLQNGIGVERLLDKVTGARVDGRECFRCLVLSGYYDDPSRRRVQSFEHVCARTIRHEQVEEN